MLWSGIKSFNKYDQYLKLTGHAISHYQEKIVNLKGGNKLSRAYHWKQEELKEAEKAEECLTS